MKDSIPNRYNSFSSYVKETFGCRVQKISINAGFTCPNRDGKLGFGGCTYCNNQSFNPEYCNVEPSISLQLKRGIDFFANKYTDQKYLAYFQAYTNTYGEIEELKRMYEEALSHPLVVGLIVGTRPDCVNDELLNYFVSLQKHYYVAIEYGVESTLDRSLERIHRGHSFECSRMAIQKTAALGIPTGAHLILGLPGESRAEILHHASVLSELPITIIKLHQLQLIKHTLMAKQFSDCPSDFSLFTVVEYIDLVVDFLELLDPRIVVERFISQSPKDILIAPYWGLKNFEFVDKVVKRLIERNTFQGRLFNLGI